MKRRTRHSRDYYRSLLRFRRRAAPFGALVQILHRLGRTRREAREEAAAMLAWEGQQ